MKIILLSLVVFTISTAWSAQDASTFFSYCQDKSGGTAVEKTIKGLLEYLETEDCALAATRLSRRHEIVLEKDFESLLPLKGLSRLKTLKVGFKHAIDHKIPFPDLDLPNLEYLGLFHRQRFTDLDNIKKFTRLKELVIFHPSEAQLGFLKEMKSLESLSLADGDIQNLSFLENAAFSTNLTELMLRGNKISDLKEVAQLLNLKKAYLHNNQISNLEPLAKLQNLEFLWLNDNKLQDIEPLSRIKSLRWLYLQHNQIEYAAPLTKIPRLQELWIYDNPIKDSENLKSMTSLKALRIKDN